MRVVEFLYWLYDKVIKTPTTFLLICYFKRWVGEGKRIKKNHWYILIHTIYHAISRAFF